MRHTTKLVLAALVATILMSFAVGSASARRIETSEQGFLVRWTSLSFNAAGNRVSCPVTLEGSFHSRTLSKVCGQLIGYVSTAQVGPASVCQAGSATVLTESLPWHILYVSFAGELPRIERIRIKLIGAAFRISAGIACLATTTHTNPAVGDINVEASGGANTLTALREFSIPTNCPFVSGNFEGTGEVFTLITPQRRIFVRLVQ